MLDGIRRSEFMAEQEQDVPTLASPEAPPLHRRLVVALDFRNANEAMSLIRRLGDSVNFYKIGLELVFGGGLELAQELRKQEKWIFLDMKFLDIGNTVEKAVANVAKFDFQFLTVHGINSKTLKAALRGRGNSSLRLLAVTVQTDHTKNDLGQQGISETPASLTLRRAKLAYDAGFDGVIASGEYVRAIRQATSEQFIIKTPGIRMLGDDVGDQVHIVTPRQAIANGANYLVVGRPITTASDPKGVAELITSEIDAELKLLAQKK